jgi:ParB family chromosome partitioning protein
MGVARKPGQSGPEPIELHDHLASLMEINVANHWRPTSANYFDRVSKQTLLAHVTEVGGPTMAAIFMGAKKGDLSASCKKLFAGETIVAPEVKQAALAWVPEAMRFRVLGDTGAGEAQPDEGVGESPNEAPEPDVTDAADEVRETVDA